MSTSIRIRKNLLGEYAPEIQKKSLSDLLRDSYFNKINLRPIYQRHIRWKPTAMNDFIGTIMNNGLVPGIIMYQLHPDERTGKNTDKLFEMVDGQHRLFTLKAFVDSTYQSVTHINKSFIVYWEYETISEDGTPKKYQVFYKKTDNVEQFCRENPLYNPQYLTEDEKEYFEQFGVNLTLIRSKIDLDKRREIFTSLQKGIPVRGSDFLKNKVDCKLIAFMNENNYEEMMIDTFFEHCSKKSKLYWVNWVCRLFILFKRFHCFGNNTELNSKPVSETYLMEDKKIKNLIEIKSPLFNPRNEEISQIHEFDDVFRAFISFLKSFDEGQELNPTQIFALFYVLCDESKDTDIILSHVVYLSKEGSSKRKKNLWESHDERGPRRKYFNECLTQISSITERAMPLDERNISKALRKLVWKKCEDGLCAVCEDEISEKEFEAGHIIARALGGPATLENLISICFACNRGMGTRNAWEFKKDMYPEYELVSQEI
jgi:hypothetical protein